MRSKAKVEKREAAKAGAGGFTLIELLVVIAIISVLAGLLIPVSSAASRKMKISKANSELNQLVTMIETYKLEVGEYPPDNPKLRQVPDLADRYSNSNYLELTAYAPLYYELTGAVFHRPNETGPGVFRVGGGAEEITAATLTKYFNVDGIRNSARAAGDIPFKSGGLKTSQYKEIEAPEDVELVVSSLPGAFLVPGRNNAQINPWHYDRSTRNRQNRNSFDLWVDLRIGKETVRIANWKEK